MKKNAIQQSFDKAAYHYDQHAILQQEVGRTLISKLTPYEYPINILDAGCGTGATTTELSLPHYHQRLDAIDISSQSLMVAKQRSYKQNIQYHHADFNRYMGPYTYDLIFSNMSLQWSCSLFVTLCNLKRNLCTNGTIHFSIPLCKSLSSIHDFSFFQLPSEKEIAIAVYHSGLYILSKNILCFELTFPNLHSALTSIKKVGACHSNQRKKTRFIKRQLLFEDKPFTLHYFIAIYTLRKSNENFYYWN